MSRILITDEVDPEGVALLAAEHGIGKLKRKWLPLQATPAEIAVMPSPKHTLDPLGLMAPGNVL